MLGFAECYSAMRPDGSLVLTPRFAAICRSYGYDDRAVAYDSAPEPTIESYDSAGQDDSIFSRCYEERANRIFEAARRPQAGFEPKHKASDTDLEAFDAQQRQWTQQYLSAQSPDEVRQAIARFRDQHSDFNTPDSSIRHLLAYERGAEAQRTRPRSIRERMRG
jgi:hypothetical protein